VTVRHGDCLDVMAGMDPESVDAIVTDPPYGLEFMGKAWDSLGGKASSQRLSPAMAAATVGYYKGRGATATNPNTMQIWHTSWAEAAYRVAKPSAYLLAFGGTRTVHRMTVALEDAGWIIRDMLVWAYASGFPKSKASLKPAWEPIVMARKPGPLRDLAIDACRIGFGPDPETPGRWPANVLLTDALFDGGIEGVVGGGETSSGSRSGQYAGSSSWSGEYGPVGRDIDGDSGTYSRFFLIPKADRADREPVIIGQVPERRPTGWSSGEQSPGTFQSQPTPPRENVHPTVKPTDLMRHLVRLVTPSGGTVLDPFLGSGTTAIAAEMEGFAWIGIEREAEYVTIAEARLNGVQKGLGLGA
jgi:DNA modification methylase